MPFPGADATRADGPRFRVRGAAALWLPVVVSFVVQVPAAVFRGRPRGWESGGLTAAIDDPAQFAARLALALVGPIALLFARRFPGPTVAVVAAAAGAYVLVVSGDTAPPYIALPFAVIGAVVRGARAWAWVSLAAAWTVTFTLGAVSGVPWQPALVVAVSLALVLCVAIGESIRSRRRRFDDLRRRAEEERRSEAQAERVRIARELHDVLAHSLSAISVQAGVGLHLIDTRPEEAARALADIKATSRAALDEVRMVLGILREGGDGSGGGDGSTGAAAGTPEVREAEVPRPGRSAPLAPEPGLDRLAGLVASLRSQGVEVELDDGIGRAPGGHDAVPRPVQLALFRIAQESLTNVVRHSGSATARVALRDDGHEYRLTVADDGSKGGTAGGPGGDARGGPGGDAAGPIAPRGGRGILGMEERAALLGGRLVAGPTPAGGFAVDARLPKPPIRGPRAAGRPEAAL